MNENLKDQLRIALANCRAKTLHDKELQELLTALLVHFEVKK